MKLIKLVLLVTVFLVSELVAQTPNLISYQAVIRNSSNVVIANKQVGMKISILKGGVMGTPVFIELHSPTTNSNGLVSIEIGNGTNIQGSISQIDWWNDVYFLQTDIDPTGGVNYSITGTSQFLTIPYAFHSKTADSVLNYPSLKVSKTADSIIFSNGYSFRLGDEDSENELQKLILINDSVKLSRNGGSILLKDNDETNEIQKLEYSNDTLRLSRNGGWIKINDFDSLNEIQTLIKRNDTIVLTKNNGFVKLNDDDSVNEIQILKLNGDTLRISKTDSFVLLNTVKASSESSFSKNLEEPIEVKNIDPNFAGLTKRNGAWTANGIYNLSPVWLPSAGENSFKYTWDVFLERNDSVFFFENGQGGDAISSYYFDKSNKLFGGPTFDIFQKSNFSKDFTTRIQTLGANKMSKKFYWINSNGLNLYDPFTNILSTTMDLFPNSNNINWLNSLIPSSTSLTYLNMVDSNLFVFFKEISGSISFYKYNFYTDKKTKIWDTKIVASNFNFMAQTFNSSHYTYITRGKVLFNDSIFVIPFNGKDNYGVEIKGKRKFGYLIFDFNNKKIDTLITNYNTTISFGMPKKKHQFINDDNYLIDTKSRKITKLNIKDPRYNLTYNGLLKFPFSEKLYLLNVMYIQKGGSCTNSISCYPDDYNYPYFEIDY